MKKFKARYLLSNQTGMAALLIVIMIAAATLIMSISSAILGLGESEMGYTAQRGTEALFIADSCMEEALRRLKLDVNYNGGNLNLGNGTCIIKVIPNSNNRTITATGTVGDYNKNIEINLTLNGNLITINSWQEI